MLKHYLTTALRNFRRHWVTTSVNVVGLALALACAIVALSVVQYFKLDDNHIAGIERTYFVTQRYLLANSREVPLTFSNAPWIVAEQLMSDLPQLELVARIAGTGTKSIVVGGNPFDAAGSFADRDYLKLFPLPFVDGDAATALSHPHSAVLSDTTAVRLFGTDQAVGRTFLLRGRIPVTVDGVVTIPDRPSHIVSRERDIGFSFEMLLSMDTLATVMSENDSSDSIANQQRALSVATYVRLPADGSIDSDVLNRRLEDIAKQHLSKSSPRKLSALPAASIRQVELDVIADRSTTGLAWSTVILALVALILVIACLNYTSLSTAIIESKRKELGVRRVLGATMKQLLSQHVVEASLLSLGALLLAFAATALVLPTIERPFHVDLAYVWQHSFPFWVQVVFLCGLSVIATSTLPVTATTRIRIGAALGQSKSAALRTGKVRWLVGAQFFLTTALLIFAMTVRNQQRGMEEHALASIPYPIMAINNNLKLIGVDFESLRTELLRRPHVESVSGVTFMPWGESYGMVALSGSNEPGTTEFPVMSHYIRHDYFSVMKIELLAGEIFSSADATSNTSAPSNVIVDRSAAKQMGYDNPQDIIGKFIFPGAAIRAANPNVQLRVIGVVEDKMMQFTTSGTSSNLYSRNSKSASTPIIRLTQGHIAEGLEEVGAAWKTLAPNFVLRSTFLDETVQRYIANRAPYRYMLISLTLVALLVAISGLVAMSIYGANRRRHEIGIRKTLGASTEQIVTLLIRDFSLPVIVGGVAAWPLAYIAANKYLGIYAYRIELTGSLFVGSLVTALAIVGICTGWQILRAARVNPATVLRHE